MLEVAFAVPGDLTAPTGGYAYARRLLALSADAWRQRPPCPAAALLPAPDRRRSCGNGPPAAGNRARRDPSHRRARLRSHAGEADPRARPARCRPRPPSARLRDGLRRGPPQASSSPPERAALAAAERVIACSAGTARLLASEFGVPPDRIAIAEPGTEPAARAAGTGAPVQLLAIGAVSPRKGYAVLVEALRDLTDLDWHLTIAGSLDHAPDAATALGDAIQAACLNRAHHRIRRGRRQRSRPSLRPRRPVRLAVAVRGLRHGAGGSDGARPAARRLDRRRGRRDRARRGRREGAARRCRRPARSAAALDHGRGRPRRPLPRAPGPPARPCRAGTTRPRASPAC